MHFNLNNIIPDTEEDKTILTKGKTNKLTKFYSAYIYSIFLEHSCHDEPLTTKSICLKIIKKFKTYIDITTIQSYIKEMKTNNALPDIEIIGNPNNGYYLKSKTEALYLNEEDRLDDYQIHHLINKVINSRNLSYGEKSSIIYKLSSMCIDQDTKEFLQERKPLKKTKNTQNARLIARLYDDLPYIIKNNLVIEIKHNIISPNKKSNEKFILKKFYIYTAIPLDESFLILGTYDITQGNSTFLHLLRFDDYKILQETFEKIPLKLKFPSLFLTNEIIEILKKENPNDFIFPTDKEINEFKAKQEAYKLERMNRKF